MYATGASLLLNELLHQLSTLEMSGLHRRLLRRCWPLDLL